MSDELHSLSVGRSGILSSSNSWTAFRADLVPRVELPAHGSE